MDKLNRFIRGARYSEKYGSHPGTPLLLGFTALGALAGADGGLFGSIGGAVFMFAPIFCLWLVGCWDRGEI